MNIFVVDTRTKETQMKGTQLFVVLTAATLLAACAGSHTQESTGEYVDDVALTTKVKTKLLSSPETSGTAITVETFKGTVQLSGFVDTETEKRRAEQLVADIDGVERVDNKITVKGTR
jgi:osmotically-inducible protein OsmY